MATEEFWIAKGVTSFDLAPVLCERGLNHKQSREVCACLDIFRVWSDKFETHGVLEKLLHNSGGDDPPDVVACFSSGIRIDMEHTSVEPIQRHWGKKLLGSSGGLIPPLSKSFDTREEIISYSNSWVEGGWVNVSDENKARHDLIKEAIETKIVKHPSGGVMVLDSEFLFKESELLSIFRAACKKTSELPNAENWIYSLICCPDTVSYYSAIFSKDIPLEERRCLFRTNS